MESLGPASKKRRWNGTPVKIQRETSTDAKLYILKQENEVLKSQINSNHLQIAKMVNEIRDNKSELYDMREEIIKIHILLEKLSKDECPVFNSYIN